jgi:hypothetical protein
MTALAFLVGAVAGACFGVVIAGLLAAHRADEWDAEMREREANTARLRLVLGDDEVTL